MRVIVDGQCRFSMCISHARSEGGRNALAANDASTSAQIRPSTVSFNMACHSLPRGAFTMAYR